MKSKSNSILKSILSFVLTAAMVLGSFQLPQFTLKARAEGEAPVKTITGLGTGAITNPVEPTTCEDYWRGSYVYYGKYDGTNPTRYRVLDKASGDFGVYGGSLLLDCDSVLYDEYYNYTHNNEEGGLFWADSTVKTGLNGDSFLTKEGSSESFGERGLGQRKPDR